MTTKRGPQVVVQRVRSAGPVKGRIQLFAEGAITIGRHSSREMRVPADLATASRQSAEIVWDGNEFRLIDRSTVDRQPIGDQAPIEETDAEDARCRKPGRPKRSMGTSGAPVLEGAAYREAVTDLLVKRCEPRIT